MMKIEVRILAVDELPPWPEMKNAVAPPCDKVAILQRGTVQGHTSVMLGAVLPSGETVFMQLTAKAFETIRGAVVGAVARFGDTLE